MKILELINSPWAIVPDKLTEIRDIYKTHLRGEKIDIQGIEARIGQPLKNPPQEIEVRDGVAIVPIEGVLAPKMNLLNDISGGASTQIIGDQFKAVMEDDAVHSVILLIDSPGGQVTGTVELANIIFDARGKKPIVALAQGIMASAAVWIGTAADEVLISSVTAQVGSIGVVATHVDTSRAEESQGVKTTEIVAGKFKRIDSGINPLTEAGRAYIQDRVDTIYNIFVSDVARNRGVEVDTVLAEMADGKMFIGSQAIEAGLVDGVSTLDALINRLSESNGVSIEGKHFSTINEDSNVMKIENLTADIVAKEFPSVYDEIVAASKEKHYAEGRDVGHKAGVEAERARIMEVKAQSVPGYEDIVEAAIADGVSTKGDVAINIIAADKVKRETKLDQIESDSPDVIEQEEAPVGAPDLSNLPIAEKCEAEWKASADLQKEFGDLEAYVAYAEAVEGGKVKILNG